MLTLVAAFGSRNGMASGFGLYEFSTSAHALGGAVIGRAVDASAVFYNPATLSDLTNHVLTMGFVTQHPRARMKVDGGRASPFDAGAFMLPHVNVALPLPAGFAFGLGIGPEYGLGSAYDSDWDLVNSSEETTVESLTLTPALAYALTDDLSVGLGLRFMWFDFEQLSQPYPGLIHHRLKGDNHCRSLGWQAGLRYRLTDDFAVGLVYKSPMQVDVDGKSTLDGMRDSWADAETDILMPDSITAGFNWDITDTWHLGAAFMWTQWSTVSVLDFKLGGESNPCELNWNDTYRFAIAPSWDFARDWTWMASYAYETDSTGDQRSTMLPAADRHLLATGLAWRVGMGFELQFSYGLILMAGKSSQASGVDGRLREYTPHRGLSHAVGFSISYSF